MVFSDTSTKQGLIEDITFNLGVDTNNFSLNDRTRLINERYKMVWTIIFESYGGWTFMDDNYSDTSTGLPYADQDLTASTTLYSLPSNSLTVNGVQVLEAGKWVRLYPITQEELMQLGGDDYFDSANIGRKYYMVQGDILRLMYSPTGTVTSGLRVYFDRAITEFAPSATSTSPGFASPFHRMLSIGASLDYAIARNISRKNELQNLWNDYEFRLRKFYNKRWKDRQPARINRRSDSLSSMT